MENATELQRTISELSSADLMKFRAWFAEFDEEAWDRQFEADVDAGRLDALGAAALAEHAASQASLRRGDRA